MSHRKKKTTHKRTREKKPVEEEERVAREGNPIIFLQISVDDGGESETSVDVGRVEIELFEDILPKTSENFLSFCTGKLGKNKEHQVETSYKNSIFHRILPDSWICGGDVTSQDGYGGFSIYGDRFDDEGFGKKHVKYAVSMGNSRPNDNGSQFFICLKDHVHLDDDHVVFGKVVEGFDVLTEIEKYGTSTGNIITGKRVFVSDCGEKLPPVEEVVEVVEEPPKAPTKGNRKTTSRKARKKK